MTYDELIEDYKKVLDELMRANPDSTFGETSAEAVKIIKKRHPQFDSTRIN